MRPVRVGRIPVYQNSLPLDFHSFPFPDLFTGSYDIPIATGNSDGEFVEFAYLLHPHNCETRRQRKGFCPMNAPLFFPHATPAICASQPLLDPSTPTPSTTPASLRSCESKHPPAFYRLCWAILCERWAAFMLTSTAALMLCERFQFSQTDALHLLGIASAANFTSAPFPADIYWIGLPVPSRNQHQ